MPPLCTTTTGPWRPWRRSRPNRSWEPPAAAARGYTRGSGIWTGPAGTLRALAAVSRRLVRWRTWRARRLKPARWADADPPWAVRIRIDDTRPGAWERAAVAAAPPANKRPSPADSADGTGSPPAD